MQNAGSDSRRSSFDSNAMREVQGLPGNGVVWDDFNYNSNQSYDAAELPVVGGVDDVSGVVSVLQLSLSFWCRFGVGWALVCNLLALMDNCRDNPAQN